MNTEQELLQKLMISKKIMEKHNEIGRGQIRDVNMNENHATPELQEFQVPTANYNIPTELMEGTIQQTQQPIQNNLPIEQKIANSKLPDEIKKLMMEHPIQQPSSMGGGSVLSNDLVEKASRLMNTNAKGEVIREQKTQRPQQQTTSLTESQIEKIVRQTVENVLKENGLIVESESQSGELFKFRVGQHLFEGKVNKIKKLSK